MKAVILAGGYGTRLSEETGIRPKPMVEIGGRPLLWHIMQIYAAAGIQEFVICCGYKSHVIKEYFANYHLHRSDVTFDLSTQSITYHKSSAEPWKITLVETGEDTMTGGRIKRAQPYVGDETFCLTYGDGVTDLRIQDVLAFHKKMGKKATMTAVQPPGRFGAFALSEDQTTITHFNEKPKGDGAYINGGYFILEPDVFSLISSDQTVWEKEPLQTLAHQGQLSAYRHDGYWQNMDTLRDKMLLEQIWQTEKAPWKIWKS